MSGLIEDENGDTGNDAFEHVTGACLAWSQLPKDEKARKYVIEANFFGNPIRQLSHEESEKIVREALDPKVR
jgi:hypothetical protein